MQALKARTGLSRTVFVTLRAMLLVAGAWLGLGAAHAADIRLMSSVALKSTLERVLPDFERASGHRVIASFGTASTLKGRIDAGEAFDLVVLLPAQVDELVQQGKVDAATRADLARAGPGLGIRTGAPQPDLSSDDKLKAYLLGAKSISHADPALGGFAAVYFVKMSTALGIAEAMKAKTVYSKPGEGAVLAARGEVELGVGMMSEVLPVTGIQALPLRPEDPASFITFVAAAARMAKDPDAAHAWLRFMQSPAVQEVFRTQGMTPVPATPPTQLKVLSVQPLRTFLDALGPEFERATGHKLVIQYDVSAALKRQIDAGEAFDVALILPAIIDELVRQGKVVAGSRMDVARAAIGVAVRKGATKPDIGSAEALKRALLDARSIAYSSEGASGTYFKTVLERLGIAAEVSSKLKPLASSAVVPAVANGDVELAVISPPAILAEPGAELVGVLPKELQNYVVYSAGVGVVSKDADAAAFLLRYLTTPAALSVMKSKGLEPVVH